MVYVSRPTGDLDRRPHISLGAFHDALPSVLPAAVYLSGPLPSFPFKMPAQAHKCSSSQF